MATNTTNYNFKKPDESDFYSVQDQNNNWDKADAALKDLIHRLLKITLGVRRSQMLLQQSITSKVKGSCPQ